jgi:peptidoglycan/LPS O-acetylase OafA/YrhL
MIQRTTVTSAKLAAPACTVPEPVSADPAARPPQVRSLTGLRFFASVAVVLCHVGGSFVFVDHIVVADGYSYIGVTFFFLLSGFVLTWSCTGQAARRFWWLRFARVWPLACLLMLFAFTVIAREEHLPGPTGHLAELALLQAWSPDQSVYFGGNGVEWSLSVELFFYALFPFAAAGLARLRARGLATTALLTLAVLALAPLVATDCGISASLYYWLFFVFPPYRFGEFLLGMVLARAVLLGLRAPWPGTTAVLGATGTVAVMWSITRYTVENRVTVQRPDVALLFIPCFVLLVWGCVSLELAGRHSWLATKPMLRLGEWSFALYLVHKPTFIFTSRWAWWHNDGGLSAVLMFAAYLALAVCVAACLCVCVERPVERRLRRLRVGVQAQ